MNRNGSIERGLTPPQTYLRQGFCLAALALCAAPSTLAQNAGLHPKLGVDPVVEQLVRAAFPGNAIRKASIYDFDLVAQQTQLYASISRAEAVEDFRLMQELAIPTHLGTRTRNLSFTAPVPAHPARTLFGTFGMPLPSEAPLQESEPNDRPWRADGMTCNDTMDGVLAPGEEDWFALIVPATQVYDIGVNSAAATDTRLTIYDQNLNRLAFNDDAGTVDPQIRITLPTGTYYLVVDGHDPLSSTGAYQIAMNCQPEQVITSASPAGGTFAGQPADTYRFNIPVDCIVTFVAARTLGSTVNPSLTITGPNGFDALISNDDAFTPPDAYVQAHLPAGFHYVHVKDSGGSGGSYTLTMSELALPIPNVTLNTPLTLSRANPFSARMLRFNNATFAEILSRMGRQHSVDVNASHIWCDTKLSTTEESAKNLTGVNITDSEQLMGLPSGTFYLLLRPLASRLVYSTRNYGRRLSSTTNHPGAFMGTLSGTPGFAANYVTPSATLRLRQRLGADWIQLGSRFTWWFDQVELRVKNSFAQTSTPVTAALMTQEAGAGATFTTTGVTPITGGVINTADGIGAACYWQDNTEQAFDLSTSAVFEFAVPGAVANADSIEFETTSFLSGNDATAPGATIPSAVDMPTFTAVTDARWEIWNPGTNTWDQLTGAFTAVNTGTTWLNPVNIPFSESQGQFDVMVSSTPRTVTPMAHLGTDYLNIGQPTIGQQHLFTYTNQARALLNMHTTLGVGPTTDPQAYVYDASGILKMWQDDRINGSLRDPDFNLPLNKGTYSIVIRSWDSCCTGSFSYVPRSRDFNITGTAARGQQVTFEINSQPNALYAIYAAASLLPFQVALDGAGIIGDLVLDVGTLSLVLSGVVPGSGLFQLPVNIPPDPSLANRTVFLQSVTIETLAPPQGIASQEQRLRIQ